MTCVRTAGAGHVPIVLQLVHRQLLVPKRSGDTMDNILVDQLLKAKKQLKVSRTVTIVATVCWLGGAVAAAMFSGHILYKFASAFSYGSLVGAFLINTDFVMQRSVATRAALIRIIETQVNRDPNALKELSDRRRGAGRLAV